MARGVDLPCTQSTGCRLQPRSRTVNEARQSNWALERSVKGLARGAAGAWESLRARAAYNWRTAARSTRTLGRRQIKHGSALSSKGEASRQKEFFGRWHVLARLKSPPVDGMRNLLLIAAHFKCHKPPSSLASARFKIVRSPAEQDIRAAAGAIVTACGRSVRARRFRAWRARTPHSSFTRAGVGSKPKAPSTRLNGTDGKRKTTSRFSLARRLSSACSY